MICDCCYYYDSKENVCTHGSPIFDIDDNCTDYIEGEVIERIRADERAKVIEEISKEVTFEEKWLLEAISEDKGNYAYNIDIAFSGIKSSLNKLKEQHEED